jgi:hypothetical protein
LGCFLSNTPLPCQDAYDTWGYDDAQMKCIDLCRTEPAAHRPKMCTGGVACPVSLRVDSQYSCTPVPIDA